MGLQFTLLVSDNGKEILFKMKLIKRPKDIEFQVNEPMLGKLIPDDGLLLEHLALNLETTKVFILSLPEDKLVHRYAEGKWTIKEVLMHLIDMERIYTYRTLRFARNDQTVLPGFDADQYILFSCANDRDVSGILQELTAIRYSTIALLNGLSDDAFLRTGNIIENPVTVRALAYHIAGHELHHINVIKERYL